MTDFVEIDKSTYPYHTIHIAGCSTLSRRPSWRGAPPIMTREQVGRTNFTVDHCSRCFGRVNSRNEAYSEFMGVIREFKENERVAWNRAHLARKYAALVIELEKVNAEMDESDEEQQKLIAEYLRTGREGDYRLPEITFGR